ncbi:MAG: ferritin-like domain-containing protein [Gammaproteobacteria bacterium]|nr:ferritin-like domain-containing protein [Gammaproteobacteria bacterium]NIR85761.1 ferritin-like domain-containing protein [Gammaproteobacteria bacterium]NIR90294.1 ferritin-like domain-containing protein [Gammaproteobacteria bacterium]NIU06895.1 ferritin-like domain-containing protein [Gammaproteobacteria bacterium]NIV53828.1 ferritin-like domain-containing protein [Gammaproteobacteria bacterium]
MKIGSEAHKELYCRTFVESHKAFEPEELPWPELDGVYLERLRSIPFWADALKTEQEAGVMVNACAEAADDSLVREAIALQGYEEARHGRLIEHMIERYDIPIERLPVPEVPADVEQAFIHFGYGECLDSFGAFGLFEIARQAAFLPEPFFRIFDHILQEEARHIVFFVNWVAWRQVRRRRGVKPLRAAHSTWHYGKAVRHLLSVIRDADNRNEGFALGGGTTFMDDLTARQFLSTCIQENHRRMSGFDARLLQPRLLPALARTALAGLKLIPQRKSRSHAAHRHSEA